MGVQLVAGAVFERDHPFTWTVEGEGQFAHERWRPGAWNVDSQGEDVLTSCTALGRVKFTIISTHRPPGYEERVFFKREFTTPDGTKYASARLMICIARKFRKDAAGFPFRFKIEEPDYAKERMPADGSCTRCGAVPRGPSGLCATCLDEDAERAGQVPA